MACRALIGVHSWGFDGPGNSYFSPRDMGYDQFREEFEAYLVDMGYDPAFYAFKQNAAEPEDMHYMSRTEIEKYGLLTEKPACEQAD